MKNFSSAIDADTAKHALILETIVKGLVDNPDNVSIEATKGDRTIVMGIRCDKDDVGKVIGKKGRIVVAIRQIMAAVAAKTKNRINITVLD